MAQRCRPGQPRQAGRGQRGRIRMGAVPGHLYWTSDTINVANLDGTNQPPGHRYRPEPPVGVAVDPTHLYWANSGSGADGTVNVANLDGSSPRVLVGGQNPPAGVAVDSTYVYWVNPDGGTVNQANLDGSNPHALVTRQNSYGVAVGP
jgi:hypothetical protein